MLARKFHLEDIATKRRRSAQCPQKQQGNSVTLIPSYRIEEDK